MIKVVGIDPGITKFHKFWLSVTRVAHAAHFTLSGVRRTAKRTGNLPTDNAIGRKPRLGSRFSGDLKNAALAIQITRL
jgi:hypothetical protein